MNQDLCRSHYFSGGEWHFSNKEGETTINSVDEQEDETYAFIVADGEEQNNTYVVVTSINNTVSSLFSHAQYFISASFSSN
jgi:hypothetical protein